MDKIITDEIINNYKIGDLIYGLSENRRGYVEKVNDFLKTKDPSIEMRKVFTYADQYNDIADISNIYMVSMNYFYKTREARKEHHEIKLIESKLEKRQPKIIQNTHELYARKVKYQNSINKICKEKYLQESNYNHDKLKKEFSTGGLGSRIIRKQCLELMKLTLEEGDNIHFVLDGLNFNDLFRKSSFFPSNFSITLSELTYCYKMYQRYPKQIFFYRTIKNIRKVPPPWLTRTIEWEKFINNSTKEIQNRMTLRRLVEIFDNAFDEYILWFNERITVGHWYRHHHSSAGRERAKVLITKIKMSMSVEEAIVWIRKFFTNEIKHDIKGNYIAGSPRHHPHSFISFILNEIFQQNDIFMKLFDLKNIPKGKVNFTEDTSSVNKLRKQCFIKFQHGLPDYFRVK